MAPVQNTFTIVPNAPPGINFNGNFNDIGGNGGGGGGGDAAARPMPPPMTTKQVKKAYRAKNKGPKLSKAEQRRQELFEQDRIRRELEKERNQARARAARDKKKEREENERAEKRKKGLPLVDVRPSQDTIARFVRPVGTKTKTNKSEEQAGDSDASGRPSPAPLPVSSPSPSPPPPPSDIFGLRDAGVVEGHSKGENHNPILPDGNDGDDGSDGDVPPPNKKRRTGTPPPCSNHVETIRRSPEVQRPAQSTGAADIKSTADVAAAELNDPHHHDNAVELPEPNPIDVDIGDVLADELVCQQLLSESFAANSSPNKSSPTKDPESISLPEGGAAAAEPSQNQLSTRRPPMVPDVARTSDQTPVPRPAAGMHQQTTTGDPSYISQSSHPSHPSHLSQLGYPTSSGSMPAAIKSRGAVKNVASYCAGEVQNTASKEVNTRDNITPVRHPPISTKKSNATHQPTTNPPKHVTRKPFAPVSAPHLNARSRNSTSMGPPPRPPKFKTSTPVTDGATNRPKFLRKGTQESRNSKPDSSSMPLGQDASALPSSTQAFVHSHLDDFFPSPSQEVRELYEDPIISIEATHTHTMARIHDTKPLSSPSVRGVPPNKASALPTATVKHSRADINAWPSKPAEHDTCDPQDQASVGYPPCKSHRLQKHSIPDIPFFSSQDFILSQDWMDRKDDAYPTANTPSHSKTAALKTNPSQNPAKGSGSTDFPHSSKKMCLDVQDQKPPKRPEVLSQLSSSGNGQTRQVSRTTVNGQPDSNCNPPKSAKNTTTQFGARRVGDVLPVSRPATAVGTIGHPRKSQEGPSTTKAALGNQCSAPPRPSPRPFFVSSNPNREFRSKYLIERNRSAVWEGSPARRKVQEDMDQFNKEEEEAAARLLMEYEGFQQPPEVGTSTNISGSVPHPETMVTEHRLSGQPSPAARQPQPKPLSRIGQTVNQLPNTKRDVQTPPKQPTDHNASTQGRRQVRPSSRPSTSYQDMLALLEKSQKQSQEKDGAERQQDTSFAPPPVASQETDYGDAEVEDSFRELL